MTKHNDDFYETVGWIVIFMVLAVCSALIGVAAFLL